MAPEYRFEFVYFFFIKILSVSLEFSLLSCSSNSNIGFA